MAMFSNIVRTSLCPSLSRKCSVSTAANLTMHFVIAPRRRHQGTCLSLSVSFARRKGTYQKVWLPLFPYNIHAHVDMTTFAHSIVYSQIALKTRMDYTPMEVAATYAIEKITSSKIVHRKAKK